MWKSKFYGAFVLKRRADLHAIDATPARWRGGAGSSLLDGASTAASSSRNDLVENYRAIPNHCLIYAQFTTLWSASGSRSTVILPMKSAADTRSQSSTSTTSSHLVSGGPFGSGTSKVSFQVGVRVDLCAHQPVSRVHSRQFDLCTEVDFLVEDCSLIAVPATVKVHRGSDELLPINALSIAGRSRARPRPACKPSRRRRRVDGVGAP